MVIIKANATRHVLSFKTAPPILHMASRRRFRAGQNQPYRDAEPYKSSLYYWWWAFLKRNSLYHKTCIQGGNGLLSKLYRDFGDIYNVGFLTWWDSHQILFAEQCSILDGESPISSDQNLLYRIDPQKSFSQIQEEIRALHLRAHAIMPVQTQERQSTAQYPIYTNVSAHTLHKAMKVWDLHCAKPTTSAYDLGILAGFKPNILPLNKYGDKRTQSAAAIERHNKQARTSIANQTNRYLRTAGQYIDNVGRGEFPKALRR